MALGYYKDGAWVSLASTEQALPAGGAAGEVLVKDSGTDFDTSWTPNVGPFRLVSGQYYGLLGESTAAPPLDRLTFAPYYFPLPVTVDAMRANPIGVAAAGGIVRFGIYLPGSDGQPDELVADGGSAPTDVGGIKVLTFTPVTLHGLFFLASVSQVATATWRIGLSRNYYFGAPSPANGATNVFYMQAQSGVTGALPANANPDTTYTLPIATQVRVA